MKIYSKKRITANTGSLEDMMNAVENRIDELESSVGSSSTLASEDVVDASNDVIDTGRGKPYLDELSQSVHDDIRDEVNDLDIQVDNVGKAVVVVINYMGNIIEFNVPFADLSMGSDVEGDSAYIGNTIRQELDNLSEGETL